MVVVAGTQGRAPACAGAPEQAADGENLYLLGRPTLRQVMHYVRGHAVSPMLRDYLDSRLCAVMPVQRRLRQVTVRFQVEETYVPAL